MRLIGRSRQRAVSMRCGQACSLASQPPVPVSAFPRRKTEDDDMRFVASVKFEGSNITDRPPQDRGFPPTATEFALACKALQQRIDAIKARFLKREPTADLLPEIEELALRARRLCDHAKTKIRFQE